MKMVRSGEFGDVCWGWSLDVLLKDQSSQDGKGRKEAIITLGFLLEQMGEQSLHYLRWERLEKKPIWSEITRNLLKTC